MPQTLSFILVSYRFSARNLLQVAPLSLNEDVRRCALCLPCRERRANWIASVFRWVSYRSCSSCGEIGTYERTAAKFVSEMGAGSSAWMKQQGVELTSRGNADTVASDFPLVRQILVRWFDISTGRRRTIASVVSRMRCARFLRSIILRSMSDTFGIDGWQCVGLSALVLFSFPFPRPSA